MTLLRKIFCTLILFHTLQSIAGINYWHEAKRKVREAPRWVKVASGTVLALCMAEIVRSYSRRQYGPVPLPPHAVPATPGPAASRMPVTARIGTTPQDFALVSAGDTPLHQAVRGDKREMVVAMIRSGYSPYVCNQAGETPTSIAVARRNTNILDFLMSSVRAYEDNREWYKTMAANFIQPVENAPSVGKGPQKIGQVGQLVSEFLCGPQEQAYNLHSNL